MFDINNILTQALTAAVQEAIKPLHEAVQALAARVDALENQAQVVDTRLGDRIAVLEQRTPAAITADAFVAHLDQQEWFWEKLTSKAAETARAHFEECSVTEGRVESLIEDAISNHCSDYDHDDYDNASSAINEADLDSIVTQDNLRDEIRQALRDATFSVDVSL